MSQQETGKKHVTLTECEICSKLEDVHTSFYKYAWPDMDRPLPDEARRLAPAEPVTADNENRHIKRCPICGTFYSYNSWYEYYVNGSEDEEELVRLTPTQARRLLTEAEHERLIRLMRRSLQDPSAKVRRYAAACLVSFHLECGQPGRIARYIAHSDREVSIGALAFLKRMAECDYKPDLLKGLQGDLESLASFADTEVSASVRCILERLAHKASG